MSNQRVTITLGRSGQVVERGGFVPDSANMHGDRWKFLGSKRSLGDRLGSNAHGSSFSTSKRQRGAGIKWSGGDNTQYDSRMSRNDLRLKLLHKRISKKNGRVVEARKQIDPRINLSKPVHSAVKRYEWPLEMCETNGSSLPRKLPPRESATDLYQVSSLRNSNSSQTIKGSRGRAPGIYPSSLGPSRQRNYDELQSGPSFRAVDGSRAGHFLRNGPGGSSQPIDPLHLSVKSAPQTAKPVAQVVPSNYSMQKIPYVGEEPLTVAGLLNRLGLGKYAIIFQAEEVDMTVLKQMGDKDLKELGIPMGPRKKILLALLACGKRHPP